VIGKDEVSEAKRDVRPAGGFRKKKLFKFSPRKFVSLKKVLTFAAAIETIAKKVL
jgi:hypothetical protein